MKRNRTDFPLLIVIFLAGIMCSCRGGQYRSRISKLHSKMSRADVVAALGKPYGEASGMIVYYDAGADTILAVQPDVHGDCQWLVLEAPAGGIPQGIAYYKVKESSSGGGPFAIGTTIYRDP